MVALLAPNDWFAILLLIFGAGAAAMLLSYQGPLGTGASLLGRPGEDHDQDDRLGETPFDRHVRLGNQFARQKKMEKALIHYEKAHQLRPGISSLMHKLARLYSWHRQPEQASLMLQAILTQEPDNASIRLDLARNLANQQDWEAVYSHLQTLLLTNPDDRQTLTLMVKSLRQLGREAESLPYLDQLMQLPDTPATARVSYQSQQIQQRLQAGESSPELIDAIQDLARLDSANRLTYQGWIGQLHLQQHQPEEALSAWQPIFEHYRPGQPASSALRQLVATYQEEYLKAIHQASAQWLSQGDIEAARPWLHQAVALHPAHIETYNLLGQLHEQQGNPDKALICYQEVLSLQPDHLLACQSMGRLLDDKGEWSTALPYHQRAMALAPEDVTSPYRLGTSLGMMGRYEEAIAYLLEALRRDPGHESALYNLAVALEHQGRETDACRAYDQLLAKNPDHYEARCNRDRLSQLVSGVLS